MGGAFLYRHRDTGLRLRESPVVGILELKGPIMDSHKILMKLHEAEEDRSIKALVLRLDSPGGSVGPSQEIYDAVKAFPKPLVVSMGSVAASGAYYIACGAKKVFANPGTLTGSIGVIMQFADLSKLYDWAKVRRYAITTGAMKDAGAEYKEMTPHERAVLQTMIDDVLEQFKQAVREGRHLASKDVDPIADGRIFSGRQAEKLHLVDALGSLEDAVKEAYRLGGIEGPMKWSTSVLWLNKRKHSFIEKIVKEFTDSEDDEKSIWEHIMQSKPHFDGPSLYWVAHHGA